MQAKQTPVDKQEKNDGVKGVNLYWGIVQNRELGFMKDSVYDVLRRPNFNWRIFLLTLSVAVT